MSEPHHPEQLPVVFQDGEIRPLEKAHVSLTDAGLLYGMGFFETFRSSGGKPHHWTYNLERLERGCAKIGLALPRRFLAYDHARLVDVVQRLLRQNHYEGDAVFRYTVTAGSNERPTEFLTCRALPPLSPSGGIALRVLKLRRDSGEWCPRPKSLNYTNALLGGRELQARKAPAADEGLFLSGREGFVVETPRQNLAWIKNGCIQQPDASTSAVAGTCQAWLASRGFPLKSAHATLEELRGAEAVFCLNSVRGITPVTALWDEHDALCLGEFKSAEHPWILALQANWAEALAATAAQV
ncbi:MAG: aminotransferase class IV [Opitutus sp.]